MLIARLGTRLWDEYMVIVSMLLFGYVRSYPAGFPYVCLVVFLLPSGWCVLYVTCTAFREKLSVAAALENYAAHTSTRGKCATVHPSFASQVARALFLKLQKVISAE